MQMSTDLIPTVSKGKKVAVDVMVQTGTVSTVSFDFMPRQSGESHDVCNTGTKLKWIRTY